MKRMLHGVIGAALAMATAAAPAQAQQYVYGAFAGPNHVMVLNGLNQLMEELKEDTNGQLQFQLLLGGQLLTGPGTLPGLRDRLADAGQLIPGFTRRELRHANVIFDLYNASPHQIVNTGAVAESYAITCKECRDDFRRHNIVYLSNYSTTSYNLLCREPIRTVADARGKRMRVVGALARIVPPMGAVPVGGDPPDAVQRLQRGAIDCMVGPISWMETFGMWGITNHVLSAPLGMQPTAMGFTMNRDAWYEMSRETREAVLRRMPTFMARVVRGYKEEDDEVRRIAAERGVSVYEGGEDFQELIEAHVKSELEIIPKTAAEQGVENAEGIMRRHMQNVAKWEKIYEEIGEDYDKFAEALWREVFSKLDPDEI